MSSLPSHCTWDYKEYECCGRDGFGRLKWFLDGTLWNNMHSTDNLKITPYWPHTDNFTVVIAELAWLALTARLCPALLSFAAVEGVLQRDDGPKVPFLWI